MGRLIKGMGASELLAVVGEGLLTKSIEAHTFEKTGGDDPVGIDVITPQRKGPSADAGNRALREGSGLGHGRKRTVEEGKTAWRDGDQLSAAARVRTSVTTPLTAAAATMAGLISRVRPLAEP